MASRAHIGGFRAPRAGGMRPMSHVGMPEKIHPAAKIHVRLPQGEVSTNKSDPSPYVEGVGKL